MRFKELHTEDFAQDIARAAQGIAGAIAGIDVRSGKAKAKDELAQDWNDEFEKQLGKSPDTARSEYGALFKKWVSSSSPTLGKAVDISKVTRSGKPDQKYMNQVLDRIYSAAVQNQKAKSQYGAPKKGTVATGSDGKQYQWMGANWINTKSQAIKPKSVKISQ